MNNKTTKNKIYYVASDKDDSVLIAMDLEVNSNDRIISWFDTVKDRTMESEQTIDENPEHFVFKRSSARGEIYTFIPMTLGIYNEKVKKRILIPRDFKKDEEMIKSFLETKNNVW